MKTYGPGEYMVEVTLRMPANIEKGEEETEDFLLHACRRLGELVDWEIE